MSRKKLSPGKARKDDLARRQRADILAAAATAFAANGFNGTQIGAIASAAEGSLTTLYSMFQSKEALYREIVIKAAAAVRDGAIHKVEHIKNPSERLMVFIDGLLNCYQENRDFMRLYVHATQGFPYRIRPELGDEALEIFQDVTAWLVETAAEAKRRGEIDKKLDPEAIAYTIMGGVVTTCSQWVERNEPRPLSAAAPALRAVFERILRIDNGIGRPKRNRRASGRKSTEKI